MTGLRPSAERATQAARNPRLREHAVRFFSSRTGLAVMFAVGLGARLWLARGKGFSYDVGSWRVWMEQAVTRGLRQLYSEGSGVNYPPIYVGVLYAIGRLYVQLTGTFPGDFVLKLPAVFADLGLAGVAMALARHVTPAGVKSRVPVRGLAAAFVLLNPAVIFISAVWGQIDSLYGLFVCLSFLRLATGPRTMSRELEGLGFLALALMTKPQSALILPIVAVYFVWRHLADSRDESTGTATLKMAILAAATFVYLLALAAPVGIGPLKVFRFFVYATSFGQVTSSWAFNLWGLAGFWVPDSGPPGLEIAGVKAFYIGLVVFVVGLVPLGRAVWRALQRRVSEPAVLLVGATATVCWGFAVLTRMHERYLFPALVLLAPLVAYRAVRRAMVVLTVLFLVNVYFVWEEAQKPIKGGFLGLIYGTTQDSLQKKVLSAVISSACIFAAWRLWRWTAGTSSSDEATVLPNGGGPPA